MLSPPITPLSYRGQGYNAVVENVHITNSEVSAISYAGGVVGKTAGYLLLSKVTSSATVKATGYQLTRVGGLLGAVNRTFTTPDPNTLITNSRCDGNIGGGGELHAGGLVGYGQYFDIKKSSFTGKLTNAKTSGGLTGWIERGSIEDSYVVWKAGSTYKYGIVVAFSGMADNRFQRNFFYGAMPTTGYGLAENLSNGIQDGNFYPNHVAGATVNSPNGTFAAPLPTEGFLNQATFEAEGWDFNQVWKMGPNHPEHR